MKVFLIVTYMSFNGIIDAQRYEMPDIAECLKQSKVINNQVRAGKVSTICWRNYK